MGQKISIVVGVAMLAFSQAYAEEPQVAKTSCCLGNGICREMSDAECFQMFAEDRQALQQSVDQLAAENPAQQSLRAFGHVQTTLLGVPGVVQVEVVSCTDLPSAKAPVAAESRLRKHPWFQCKLVTACGEVLSAAWPMFSRGHLSGLKVYVDPIQENRVNTFNVRLSTKYGALAVTSAEAIDAIEVISCE